MRENDVCESCLSAEGAVSFPQLKKVGNWRTRFRIPFLCATEDFYNKGGAFFHLLTGCLFSFSNPPVIKEDRQPVSIPFLFSKARK